MCTQGIDVDVCYDTAYWKNLLDGYNISRGNVYDSTYDMRYFRILARGQVEALRSDMCGWRMAAKRGYIGALQGTTKATLQVAAVLGYLRTPETQCITMYSSFTSLQQAHINSLCLACIGLWVLVTRRP
jgi:hypothetical protein